MTQTTLSSVTLKTLGNCRKAATRAVGTYHRTGRQVIRAVDARVHRGLQGRPARLAPTLSTALLRAQDGLTDAALRGLDALCNGTRKAIEVGTQTVAEQVSRAATLASSVDNPLLAQGLDAAARWTLPGAQAALRLSDKVAPKAAPRSAAKGVRKAAKRAPAARGQAFEAAIAAKTQRGRRGVKKAAAPAAPAKSRKTATKRVRAAAATEAAAA